MDAFTEGLIKAAAGTLITGVLVIIGLLIKVVNQVSTFGPSLEAIYRMLPFMLRAQRFQNSALREIGANGSTEKADACLDEAEAALNRRLAERVGGAA